MVPFQDNFVTLSSEEGKPKTTYVNASPISFKNTTQTFIATQAPLHNSFQNFWRMILEKKVSVIVMLTALDEGIIKRKKADKYWPDKYKPVKDLKNGIILEYLSISYQGTYTHRKIRINESDGTSTEVSQLQTVKWADLTAPDSTKIMMDMVHKAKELNSSPEDPILVHCSAGVGRTGTFIAVFKLVDDYHDKRKRFLNVYKTVMKMRKQRMKMVQKPEQYSYIFKCIREEIKTEEGQYYEEDEIEEESYQ